MQKFRTIDVEDKHLKLPPNLSNYEKAYRDYDLAEWARGEIEYFEDGKINAAYNAVERHANNENKNKVALYLVDENLNETKLTFFELNRLTNQFANFLKSLDIAKGDRVFFFLPRNATVFYGFLGTLKIGAIAGTMFSAFGPDALYDRLENSGAKVLITTTELLPRLKNVRRKLPALEHVITTKRLAKILNKHSDELHTSHTDPDDPAFMLYTSGTTGKPKGVVHAHKAIITQHLTAKYVLDLKPSDVYWCTADPGWITGVAYQILGTLSNAASTVIYAGRFDPKTWYQIIEKYRVTVWYSAPTAIRMLQAAGDELVKFHNLSSLRHLGSVGEPLNPEPLSWGHRVFKQAFHDTWWQTETGAICIANYPCLDIRVGSMGKPFPGITADIVDDKGNELPPLTEGNLALKKGFTSQMIKIWKRPKKFKSYFIKSWYITGDRAYLDKDGYFWFVGRADDVIKTQGERVGPFEVESAIISHPACAEAGVIGKPDPLRGQIIKAFIALKPGFKPSEKLKLEISEHVKHHLAGHAYPREIEFVDSLPKTRSGKIVRRLLRAKELGLPLGDTSTLEEF
ncbi:MAG: acetate--CoA ligase [Patescibacteria group bacterium]